ITIGMASKWRETVIIKASGSSTKKFFSSFLVLGVIISMTALILGETVVPDATEKAAYLRKVNILKQLPSIVHQEKALWVKGHDGSLIRISGFLPDQDRVLETSIFTFNSSFGLEKRIEAQEALWKDSTWNLKDVTVFDFRMGTTRHLDTLATGALGDPELFREEIKKPEEMNFMELYDYYGRLEKAGFRNLKYTVRLYEKLAYPAINFVMILFGVALALNTSLGGGVRSAGLGVIVSVLYWLLYSLSISLGNTGVLQPWLAPWVSPLVFGIAGTVLYLKIQE
ncbi:MAG: LptF/LptG family permease, partial [Nitrospiraceae bacterium]